MGPTTRQAYCTGTTVRRNFAKALLPILVAGAVLTAPAAEARDWQGLRMQAQNHPVKKGPPPPPQRREGDKRGEYDKRHPNRLTDQERRDLRRDVDRADREIYRR